MPWFVNREHLGKQYSQDAMVCDTEYKMQVYPGNDAALQEGTKLAKPVINACTVQKLTPDRQKSIIAGVPEAIAKSVSALITTKSTTARSRQVSQ